jgi:hypothetical protein
VALHCLFFRSAFLSWCTDFFHAILSSFVRCIEKAFPRCTAACCDRAALPGVAATLSREMSAPVAALLHCHMATT